MAAVAARLAAGALGKKAYEKSGLKKAIHKIPVVGDIASIFGFKNGGRVPKTGVYKLHKGEVVIPNKTVNKIKKRAPRKTTVKVKNVRGKVIPTYKRKAPPKDVYGDGSRLYNLPRNIGTAQRRRPTTRRKKKRS